MTSSAKTPEEYLAELPPDRREALSKIRDVINAHLPEGLEEGMEYGAISWHVPHSVYPAGYHCDKTKPVPFIGLASQKQHMAAYLCLVYMSEEIKGWFMEEYAKLGMKIDMGASCVRFKKIENFPLQLMPELLSRLTVPEFLKMYEESIPPSKKKGKA
jgi:hypothetical protein